MGFYFGGELVEVCVIRQKADVSQTSPQTQTHAYLGLALKS